MLTLFLECMHLCILVCMICMRVYIHTSIATGLDYPDYISGPVFVQSAHLDVYLIMTQTQHIQASCELKTAN